MKKKIDQKNKLYTREQFLTTNVKFVFFQIPNINNFMRFQNKYIAGACY